jgi:uncharacterized 2Fe-2S/4Fe-4S cluster protein (DUF4445 family)
MQKTKKTKVEFIEAGISAYSNLNENLLEIALRVGLDIEASCGSLGTCGKCKVQITEGNDKNLDQHELSSLSKNEIESGYRLACRVLVNNDMTVLVPETNSAQFRKTKMGVLPTDFQEYLTEKQKEYNLQIEKNSENASNAIAKAQYGIAFDIGTTTVVGTLWNLASFQEVAVSAKTNPQGNFGGDVISRINYANQSDENLKELKVVIGLCLNEIVQDFVKNKHLKISDLIKIVIVGNTTMSHLLLGVSPRSLAIAPFKPEFLCKEAFTPKEIMIEASDMCKARLLPNIAGHVGSDIVGVILASRLTKQEGTNLAIDIGTNGEIILSDNGHTYACSTAAGPAFEGVSIGKGMRASRGAIEAVKIDGIDVKIDVIDNVEAIGICGSGLIDAISEMLKSKLIDFKGRLSDKDSAIKLEVPEHLINRLRDGQNGREFVLAFAKDSKSDDVVITQKDIREVQLAKGAIYSGIKILLNICSKEISDIDKIFMAGAFGNYINKASAVRIGLLPDIGEENIISIGNAACTGAFMALLSKEEREFAFALPEKITHMELAGYPNFQDEYIKAMNFPQMI